MLSFYLLKLCMTALDEEKGLHLCLLRMQMQLNFGRFITRTELAYEVEPGRLVSCKMKMQLCHGNCGRNMQPLNMFLALSKHTDAREVKAIDSNIKVCPWLHAACLIFIRSFS